MLGESWTIVSQTGVSQESCKSVGGTLCMASMTFPIYKERIRYEGKIYGFHRGGGGRMVKVEMTFWTCASHHGELPTQALTIDSALLSLLALYWTRKKSAATFLRVAITVIA